MVLQVRPCFAPGVLRGRELKVAAFASPTLNQQPHEARIRPRSALAAGFWPSQAVLDGRFCVALNLTLVFEHSRRQSGRLAATAFAILLLAVLFSLVGPVPINNRIRKWTPESVPSDRREQEHRWDLYPSV